MMMFRFLFTALNLIAAAHAAPATSNPDGDALERLLDHAGLIADQDDRFVRGCAETVAAVAAEVARERRCSIDEARAIIDLTLDPARLLRRAFSGSGFLDVAAARFDDSARRAVIAALALQRPPLGRMIEEAASVFAPRTEVLRRLGLTDWRAEDLGLELSFVDERWHWHAFLDPAWSELLYTNLREFAAAHLTKLEALRRARAEVARLVPSIPRARALTAIDEVATALRAQVLDLPQSTELMIERLRDRRASRRQQRDAGGWEPLGGEDVTLTHADWHRLLEDVLYRRGHDRALVWPEPVALTACERGLGVTPAH